jgi:hypothetical protein
MTKNCPRDDPVPLRELLRVYPVILSVSNYVVLAFLSIALGALLPLFLAMPLHIGGLNFNPPSIGYIIGAYGGAGAIFQAFYFARIVNYFGERKIFISAMALFIPAFMSFPLINATALRFGNQSGQVWFLIAILLAMLAFLDMAYGMLHFPFLYVNLNWLRRDDFHVHHCFSSQQAILRCDQWALADHSFHSPSYRASLVDFAILVLRRKEPSRRLRRIRYLRNPFLLRITPSDPASRKGVGLGRQLPGF